MNAIDKVVARLKYTPSHYQLAIADWIVNGRGHAMVNAVAGSGKTSTLVDIAAPLLRGQAVFCAFNKHIANELGDKLPRKVSARTLHSLGYACIRYHFGSNVQVDGGKYRKILGSPRSPGLLDECFDFCRLEGRELTADERAGLSQDGAPENIRTLCSKFVNLCRCTLTKPTLAGLEGIAEHFGIPVEPHQWALALAVVKAALRIGAADVKRSVDYTDMVWLPNELNLRPLQFNWVMVDECQDLNAAQLGLALKLCRRNGRMLFVGDPNQAIYGFAGADCDSFWNIQKRTGAKVLPLSICYRCPSEHVALAQAIVPQIEAAPNAIDGGVFDGHDLDELSEMVVPEDVVLCRNTAPLVKACYRLLRDGKPAYVAGRAIGEGIAKAIDEACKLFKKKNKRTAKFEDLGDAIDLWESKEQASLRRRQVDEDDQLWSDLSDRVECMDIFWSRSEASTVDGFLSEIQDLFAEDKNNATRLSTVHRAKGLEADRVWILNPGLMPSRHARMSWERQQEENLRYVAYTRAKEALHFVAA